MGLVRDYKLNVANDVERILQTHGIMVQVTRQTLITPSSREQVGVFGTNAAPPSVFMAKIYSPGVEVESEPTEAGGKKKELLHFVCQVGVIHLADELLYSNGNTYKVTELPEGNLGGEPVLPMGVASREVF